MFWELLKDCTIHFPTEPHCPPFTSLYIFSGRASTPFFSFFFSVVLVATTMSKRQTKANATADEKSTLRGLADTEFSSPAHAASRMAASCGSADTAAKKGRTSRSTSRKRQQAHDGVLGISKKEGGWTSTLPNSASHTIPNVRSRDGHALEPPPFLFEICPSEVVFNSFSANMTYTATLELKNRASTNEYVRIAQPDSHVFSVQLVKGSSAEPNAKSSKVAAGLAATFQITFSPDSNIEDYHSELTILTERGECTVPLHAFANRGSLELPSSYVLHAAPVKGTSETTIFLRNTSGQPCAWRVEVEELAVAATHSNSRASPDKSRLQQHPPMFVVSPDHGTAAPFLESQNDAVSITPISVQFNAKHLQPGSYASYLRFFLSPEGDVVQTVPMSVEVVELPGVCIEQDVIEFADTYVTTERQAVVRLTNTSDETIQFRWQNTPPFTLGESSSSCDDGLASLVRTHSSDVFSIEPNTGTLYGRGSREFTITFNPRLAVPYDTVLNLDVTGRQLPLPLTLHGHGLGPRCELSFDRLQIGSVYLNAVHEYEVELRNACPIDAYYHIIPPLSSESTVFTSKFTFTPSSGTLRPGEGVTLTIRLQSDAIGSFSEHFSVHLRGSLNALPLVLRGRVMGPSFQCDIEELDFGNVSYNLWHIRTFSITNTSQIPMNYHLQLPPNVPYAEEFIITPNRGVLGPMNTASVEVRFISNTVGEYDTALMIQVAEIGDALDSIPIKAMCHVPLLYTTTERLTFGCIFVGQPFTLNAEVVNDTALTGKFVLALTGELPENSEVPAEVSIGPGELPDNVHLLEPHQKTLVPITITASCPGSLIFSLALRVLGLELVTDTDERAARPHAILVTASSSGPNVEVEPSSINFGSVPVLKTNERELTLQNTSPIPAPFTILAKTGKGKAGQHATISMESSTDLVDSFVRPVFSVEPAEGVLEPHSTLKVVVRVYPDEAFTFTGELVVRVPHLSESKMPVVALKATGKGFALVSERSLELVDLGDAFTDTPLEEQIVVHNRGRRDQEVQWQNIRGTKAKEGAPPIAFAYRPERFVIPARGSAVFIISGGCSEPGERSETFSLKQSGSFAEILRSTVQANFMAPTLSYSASRIDFNYANSGPDVAPPPGSTTNPAALVRSVTLRNPTSKELTISLRMSVIQGQGVAQPPVAPPFVLEGSPRITLGSGEACVVGVRCNPFYRGDNVSHVVKARLGINFANHDRKESLSLSAVLLFPSIKMEPPELIEFGTVLKDTEQRRSLILSNPSSSLPATFVWKLREMDEPNGTADAAEVGSATASATSAADAVASEGAGVVQHFDIVPFTGTVQPGGQQEVEVIYRGHLGAAVLTAVCQVMGGPTYTIQLRAAADMAKVEYDKTLLDFGCLQYYQSTTQYILVTNVTHVPMPWHVDLSSLHHPECIKVKQMSGIVHDKVRLALTFCPVVPDVIDDTLRVCVGHLDPQNIRIRGVGLLNRIFLEAKHKPAGSSGVPITVTRQPFPAYSQAMSLVCEAPDRAALYFSRLAENSEEARQRVADAVGLNTLEAERVALCSAIRSKKEILVDKGSRKASDNSKFLEPRIIRRSSASASGSVKLAIAHYLVDFGHMTRADTRVALLRVVNTSPDGVFVMIDQKELSKLPISVEPVKGLKVPPFDSGVLEVTLRATEPEPMVQHGENHYEFTIDVKGGPAVVVECRCYVATPALQTETKVLGFGEVLLGQVKVLPLVLTNPEAIPCPWRVTLQENRRSAQETTTQGVEGEIERRALLQAPQFWVNEERGVLVPNSQITVQVFYAPSSITTGSAVLHYRCGNGSMNSSLDVKLTGSGRSYGVNLSVEKLELPPMRPHQVAHEVFSITNGEDAPVEVYSVHLDPQHAQETTIFRRALEIAPSHQLFMQSRQAGERLPNCLLEGVYQYIDAASNALAESNPITHLGAPGAKMEGEEDEATAANQSTRSKHSSGGKERRSTGRENKGSLHSASGLAVGIGPAAAGSHTAAVQDSSKLVLLIGPPRSGKSTLTDTLVREDGYTLVDLDALLLEEAGRDTASGAAIRFLLTNKAEAADPKRIKDSQALPPPSPPPPPPPAPHGKKNAAAAGNAAGARAVSLQEEKMDSDLATYQRSVPNLLRSVLTSHLKKSLSATTSHLSNGALTQPRFIMGHLRCSLTPNLRLMYDTLQAVCTALHIDFSVLSLDVSEPTSGLRGAVSRQHHQESLVEEATITPLPEADYAALSKEEREDYNSRLKHLNDCRRKLRQILEEREQLEAQLPYPTVQGEISQAYEEQRAAILQQLAEATAGGQRHGKNNRAAEEKPVPEPSWNTISPLEAFREFYASLLREQTAAATAAATVKGAPPFVERLHNVEAESLTPTDVYMAAKQYLPQIAEQTAEPPHSSSGATMPEYMSDTKLGRAAEEPHEISFLSPTFTTSGVCTTALQQDQYGEWLFLDNPRLLFWGTSLAPPSSAPSVAFAHYARFFSSVEREVFVAKKANAKKKSTPTTIQQREELTRWVIPPKSSVEVTVELSCENVGPYQERCLFAIAGTMQRLTLDIAATVALPDICRDAKVIFPVVRPRLTTGKGSHKVYITTKKVFDFGPLLIPPPAPPKTRRRSDNRVILFNSEPPGWNAAMALEKTTPAEKMVPDNSSPGRGFTETLTLFNNGAGEAEVSMSFLNEKEKNFSIHPNAFKLPPGTSQLVVLKALVDKAGKFSNTLLACVKDNPVPWTTDVTFTGVRPNLTINGQKEFEMNFERLALNRSAVQSVSLTNEGPLPLRWRLVPFQLDTKQQQQQQQQPWPPEIHFSATSGIIDGSESETLSVTFAPSNPCVHTLSYVILVADPQQALQAFYENLPFFVKAESHDVVLEWTREVHFGTMHVGEEKQETIRVMNKSPYDVSFLLRLPKRMQKVLRIAPSSGIIRGMLGYKDAAIVTIDVTAQLDKEGELPKKLAMIEAAFFDADKKELLYPLQSIPVTGEAWYTKFVVKPSSVHFGSCLVGQLRETNFEIRNTGCFPVDYQMFNYRTGPDDVIAALAAEEAVRAEENTRAMSTVARKGVSKAGGAALRSLSTAKAGVGSTKRQDKSQKVNELDFLLGIYTCKPCTGTIPVGGSQVITVSTTPAKNCRTQETLGIYVPQSGPDLETLGMPVQISAFPAVPSIASDLTSSTDIETIFEEQRVVYRLDQRDKSMRAYSREEKLFTFGNSLVGHRTEERFRIANSSPLPCSIVAQLECLSSSGVSGSAAVNGRRQAGSQPKPDGFDIGTTGDGAINSPGNSGAIKLLLPPFESRFIVIGFTPSSMNRFDARLVVTVENSGETDKNRLVFDVAGEGTLPNVEFIVPPRPSLCGGPVPVQSRARSSEMSSVNSPRHMERKKAGRKAGVSQATSLSSVQDCTNFSTIDPNALELPLTRVGETSTQKFVIRNNGSVPAEVQLETLSNPLMATGLTLSKKPRNLVVAVGSEETVEVTYTPTTVGTSSMRLRAIVADNPFEEKELAVVAKSFDGAISFIGIHPAHSDFLDAGDCFISEEKHVRFSMRNNTSGTLRYEWETPSGAKMVPSAGHLAAGATQELMAEIVSDASGPTQRLLRCSIHAQSIQLLNPLAEWHNNLTSARWVLRDDDLNNSGKINLSPNALPTGSPSIGRRNLKQVLEPVPESEYRLTDEVSLTQAFSIGYQCSIPTYTLSLIDSETGKVFSDFSAISFPLTKLFQRRIATLRLTNTGVIGLPFVFTLKETAATTLPASAAASPSRFAAEAVTEATDATATGLSTYVMEDQDRNFTVSPATGVVAAGSARDVQVVFAPQVASAHKAELVGTFRYSEQLEMTIPISGVGECPLVHFQVPETDYLKQRALHGGEAGPITDPDTVVVEFLARGLHSKSTVRFAVLNPTAGSYSFEWSDGWSATNGVSPFRCLTPTGTVAAGRQTEVSFEFFAEALGTRELRCTFHIPGRASIPFLLVGKAVEPDVFFNVSKLNFDCVQVGSATERLIYIENRDDVPFTFAFDRSSMEGTSSFLTVKPVSAAIAPRERLPITVIFTPQDEVEYNVPLVCHVKRSSVPLSVNVKGEGVGIHDALQIEAAEEERDVAPVVVQRGTPVMLNLGRVQVDAVRVRNFVLSNMGNHSYRYRAEAPDRRYITLENSQGVVQPKQRVVMVLKYSPGQEEVIRQYRLNIRLEDKIAYRVGIQGTAFLPKLQLSFNRYDFGPRFIAPPNNGVPAVELAGLTEASATLELTNQDAEMISVDCNIANNGLWCRLDASSLVVPPQGTASLRLTFVPTELRLYEDTLLLHLNGVHTIQIPIFGEGAAPRVEVLNPFVKLGVARIGETRHFDVKVHCLSKIATPISFASSIDEDLMGKGVSISTLHPTLVLKPKEVVIISISFTPTQRMGEFNREVKMAVCGKEVPFVSLIGSCEDSEVHLDTAVVSFTDIVVGSSASRRVVILNSGDISQKFSWVECLKNMKPPVDLSIIPASGYVRAHAEVACSVIYSPQNPSAVPGNRSLVVEFDNSPPISITVETSTMSQPVAGEVVRFNCAARESVTIPISLESIPGQSWTANPTIDNPRWTAPSQVVVKAKGAVELPVTYHPMTPTPPSHPDRGILFIPKPDGSGLSYTLEGVATTPGPAGPLQELQTSTNTPLSAKFAVRNWSNTPLRFIREMVWSPLAEEEEVPITTEGPSTIEVLPGAAKDYSLILTAAREGLFRGTIRFVCYDRSDMLQHYDLQLRVATTAMATTVALAAAVRELTTYYIPLSSGLAKPTTYTIKLDGPGAEFLTVPSSVVVDPRSQAKVPVQFIPLLEKPLSGPVRCSLTSPELGVVSYLFQLSISPALTTEKLTRLVCPLGQHVNFTLRFQSYAKTPVEFSLRIGGETVGKSSATFTRVGGQGATIKVPAVPTILPPISTSAGTSMNGASGGSNAGGGGTAAGAVTAANSFIPYSPSAAALAAAGVRSQDVVVEFSYEPSTLGETSEIIEFSSSIGGTYTFPVIATCIAPQRQGPFSTRLGQNLQLPFKNVFNETVIITVTSDCPNFIPMKRSEAVLSRKTVNVNILSKADDGPASTVRGKVTVSCTPSGKDNGPVEWVYYVEASPSGEGNTSGRSTSRKK